jgi:hypothetical protein
MLQACVIRSAVTLARAQCFMFFERVMKCLSRQIVLCYGAAPKNIGAGKYGKEGKTMRMDQR